MRGIAVDTNSYRLRRYGGEVGVDETRKAESSVFGCYRLKQFAFHALQRIIHRLGRFA